MTNLPDQRATPRPHTPEQIAAMSPADRSIFEIRSRTIAGYEAEKDLAVLRSLVRDALDDVEAAA